GSLPWSIQRRTVSSLTPRSAAASLIRKFGTEDRILPRMRIMTDLSTVIESSRKVSSNPHKFMGMRTSGMRDYLDGPHKAARDGVRSAIAANADLADMAVRLPRDEYRAKVLALLQEAAAAG